MSSSVYLDSVKKCAGLCYTRASEKCNNTGKCLTIDAIIKNCSNKCLVQYHPQPKSQSYDNKSQSYDNADCKKGNPYEGYRLSRKCLCKSDKSYCKSKDSKYDDDADDRSSSLAG